MREIYNTWLNDHTSWMNAKKLHTYELQLASTDWGAEQRAHQMRRSAFSAYLFHLFGSRHILLACIQHPICSGSQPEPSWIPSFVQAWDSEKTSPDYQKRREISKTFKRPRTKLNNDTQAARQVLAHAREIKAAIEKKKERQTTRPCRPTTKHLRTPCSLASSPKAQICTMQPQDGIEERKSQLAAPRDGLAVLHS